MNAHQALQLRDGDALVVVEPCRVAVPTPPPTRGMVIVELPVGTVVHVRGTFQGRGRRGAPMRRRARVDAQGTILVLHEGREHQLPVGYLEPRDGPLLRVGPPVIGHGVRK